jgi:hypothetical protein
MNPVQLARNAIGGLLGHGSCIRCGRTWWLTDFQRDRHEVVICHGAGDGRLCERCWVSMSEVERMDWTRWRIAVHIGYNPTGGSNHDERPCAHRSVNEALDCMGFHVMPPLCAFPEEERPAIRRRFTGTMGE